MKVLFFAHDATLYGASQSLLTLIKGLRNKGVESLVLLPYSGLLEEKFKEAEIQYKVIGFPRCVYDDSEKHSVFKRISIRKSYNRQQRDVASKLREIFSFYKPDIVYSNTSTVSIGYIEAANRKIPHIWHVREFGNLDYNLRYLPNSRDLRKMISNTDHTIFVSKALQTHWTRKENGRHSIIYNGISGFLKERSINRRTLHNKRFNVGILGAITPGKGQRLAVEAFLDFFKLVPYAQLYVYGEAIDKQYYQTICNIVEMKEGANHIHFMGFRPSVEIYETMDVVISCSVSEAFGRSVVEAMANGIPVIAKNSGGIPEIIKNGHSGILFNGERGDLITSLLALTDPTFYDFISENGIARAAYFSVERYVNEVYQILTKALITNP